MGWLASLLPMVGSLIEGAIGGSSGPSAPPPAPKPKREIMPVGRSQMPVSAVQDPGVDPRAQALREALSRGFL